MCLKTICLSVLAISIVTESSIVNSICKVKEDKVFEGLQNITAEYVQFRLYTRTYLENFQRLSDLDSIRHSSYNPDLKTIFIIHGLGGFADASSLVSLKELILMHDDINVIIVDWSIGANEEYIPHAVRNAVASAREVAVFIKRLMETSRTSLNSIHLIGFSLGAQLASFVGKQLNKVGRITALDPAGPCFSTYANNHRLHYTDAEFVDVIITNADGLGLKQPSGHVNFVVNGGKTQSECGAVVLRDYHKSYDYKLLFIDSCSHHRALYYYQESLKNENCQFVGYSCLSYEDFLNGECTDCDRGKCAPLGYKAADYKPNIENQTKVFFLRTAAEFPYCLHHYSVVLKLRYSTHNLDQIGQLYLTLEGAHEKAQQLLNHKTQRSDEPEKEYRFLFTHTTNLGYLKSAKLLRIRTTTGPTDIPIYVDSIEVSLMNGAENKHSTVFKTCGRPPLISGVQLMFSNERHIIDECL